MRWQILLCSDGSPEAEACETMLRGLYLTERSDLVVLGVVEPGHDREALETSVRQQVDRLRRNKVSAEARFRKGHAAEEILAEAEEHTFQLVVVGARGRRGLTRFHLGSTASRLANHLSTSLLAVRRPPPAVENMLICISGQGAAAGTLQLAGALAAGSGAQVTLLHVMSQVALTWESPVEDLVDTAESALERKSPEGRILQIGLEGLRQGGLTTSVLPRLRHGLVVDEVLDEVRESNQQLLVIGAHRSPETRNAVGPLLDDVAEQLLTNAPCSVLIIRAAGD